MAAIDAGELDRTDRILLGACAGIWLAALGAGVAATVALVDLGRGHTEASGEQGTPWLLYTIIVMSALVIIGAVPLLLRARREAAAAAQAPPPSPVRPAPPGAPRRGVEPPTEKLRAPSAAAGGFSAGPGYTSPWAHSPSLPPALVAAVDQVWLRFTLIVIGAVGIAMVAIGVATYLMAVESNAAAWTFYAVTALVIAAMPVALVFYLRELRGLLDSQAT